jgi:hypothetical protein
MFSHCQNNIAFQIVFLMHIQPIQELHHTLTVHIKVSRSKQPQIPHGLWSAKRLPVQSHPVRSLSTFLVHKPHAQFELEHHSRDNYQGADDPGKCPRH